MATWRGLPTLWLLLVVLPLLATLMHDSRPTVLDEAHHLVTFDIAADHPAACDASATCAPIILVASIATGAVDVPALPANVRPADERQVDLHHPARELPPPRLPV